MSWDYRVIHMQQGAGDDLEEYYAIVEMFYAQGNPNGWGDAAPQSESLEGLDDTLTRMRTAFLHPVIEVCGECHNTAPGHRPDCSRLANDTKGRAS